MKPTITPTEEDWIITPEDLTHVMKKSRDNRLIFALMLLFYRIYCRFPTAPSEFHPKIIDIVAQQISGIPTPQSDFFEGAIRTWRRHCNEIRQITGFREATNADADMLIQWLQKNAAIVNHKPQSTYYKS